MSQTTQFVSIPLAEGIASARIASTVWGVGGAKIEGGRISFQAGPDLIGARYLKRSVIVQDTRKPTPEGYKNAGEIIHGGRRLNVLVELSDA